MATTTSADRLDGANGGRDWARRNLFNNWYNSAITIVFSVVIGFAAIAALRWVVDGDFTIVVANLRVFMIGQFPTDELWRPWASLMLLLAACGLGSGASFRANQISAAERGLEVETHSWPDLARRFWAAIAVTIFFVSFARTWPPYAGVVAIFGCFVIGREIGRRGPAGLRLRATLAATALGLLSLLVLAGTGGLGALAAGALVGWWVWVELARRDRAPLSTMVRFVISTLLAGVVWVAVNAVGLDGFGWDDWGGLHLSLFVTAVGISVGLPIGIVLALGRQSNLPVVKGATVVFIEFVRGVPLISLLLFSTFMLPLFVPIDLNIPGQITRAMIVITAFSAAYIAEIVRGGLQAVPRGQVEAAQAVGMSPGAIQRRIVLPQALRAVIPALVGQFISLLKDTSLLSIIGVLEFLQASEVANNQPEFLGKELQNITYPFVALGYWAFAYTMSKESRRIEEKLAVGDQ